MSTEKVRPEGLDVKFESDEDKRSPSGLLALAFYILSIALLALAIFTFTIDSPSNLWNGVGLLSFSVTSLGVAIALSIYRRQGVEGRRQVAENRRQGAADARLLEKIDGNSTSAATHAASTYDIVKEMGNVRDIADAALSAEPGVGDAGIESEESTEEFEAEESTEEVEADIVRVGGDGEYRKPAAVPLSVLADLVQAWDHPRHPRDRWTVGNLVGSYRKMNANGKLTSAPWIVTFRRSGGEQVNYRVAYAGTRGRGPVISEV
ncbi:hypothetical protein ACR8AL_00750 [Clavibacter sepedonicus]|uniref:hypothetical protein n=1 Tax=Clavibacter TaxID=1573 RepID=UPI0010557906|nr:MULTISPECIES: hypothetical protein [Clavibacter]MBD5382817.1 hypothetical protein [Clavibacter sp.]UUK64806.1 hypothetical protein LRE50_10965 [Clavibacter sepedonicus]